MFNVFYFSIAKAATNPSYRLYKWKAKTENGLILEVEVKAPEQARVSLKVEKLEFKFSSIIIPPLLPPASPIPLTIPEINVKLKMKIFERLVKQLGGIDRWQRRKVISKALRSLKMPLSKYPNRIADVKEVKENYSNQARRKLLITPTIILLIILRTSFNTLYNFSLLDI